MICLSIRQLSFYLASGIIRATDPLSTEKEKLLDFLRAGCIMKEETPIIGNTGLIKTTAILLLK